MASKAVQGLLLASFISYQSPLPSPTMFTVFKPHHLLSAPRKCQTPSSLRVFSCALPSLPETLIPFQTLGLNLDVTQKRFPWIQHKCFLLSCPFPILFNRNTLFGREKQLQKSHQRCLENKESNQLSKHYNSLSPS